MKLSIGTRVRFHATSDVGTIFAVPYRFRGEWRCGVEWADRLGFFACPVSQLVPVSASVPLEARPLSVGALR